MRSKPFDQLTANYNIIGSKAIPIFLFQSRFYYDFAVNEDLHNSNYTINTFYYSFLDHFVWNAFKWFLFSWVQRDWNSRCNLYQEDLHHIGSHFIDRWSSLRHISETIEPIEVVIEILNEHNNLEIIGSIMLFIICNLDPIKL